MHQLQAVWKASAAHPQADGSVGCLRVAWPGACLHAPWAGPLKFVVAVVAAVAAAADVTAAFFAAAAEPATAAAAGQAPVASNAATVLAKLG